nr:MAG TPA: hypothetical protein [Crassvirales sp.]
MIKLIFIILYIIICLGIIMYMKYLTKIKII